VIDVRHFGSMVARRGTYAREDLTRAGGPAFALNLNTGPGMEQHAAYQASASPTAATTSARGSSGNAEAAGGLSPSATACWRAIETSTTNQKRGSAPASYAAEGGLPAQTILGACRTWAWATDGRWRSNGESAAWARERLADPGPVDRALRERDGAATTAPPDADVDAVLAVARRALLGSEAPPA